jgi:hypothetical protein
MAETNLLMSGKTTFNEPTPADQDVTPLSINSDGRLRVASKPAQFSNLTGNLALLNDVLTVNVQDASNIVCHVKNTGGTTSAAGTFVFEGSLDSTDGVNGTWFGIQACRSNANTIESTTGTLALASGVATAYSWELSVNAVKWFRVRCSVAATVGSIFTWTALPGSYATEPIPALATHAVTISGTATTTPATSTGYLLTTAATTNAASVKATSCMLGEISVFNATAATIYVKLYNKATAPTVGTDVPTVTIPVAAGAFASYEFGSVGKRFALGMGIAVTAAAAATDTTVIAAGAQIHASYI